MIRARPHPEERSKAASRMRALRALLRMIALTLALAAIPATAQNVRTTIKPENGIVLGQHVRVMVDVLFPDAMPRPPRVSLPETRGAQILRYETQATTMSERIDGKEHAGQRFEFALYPRRGGTLEVPAPQVTVLDRTGGETGRLSGTPSKIEVAVPAGVDPSKPVVATTALKLDQRWQPDPTGKFKAGDALVRTITRQAADIPGMAMLDLAFAAPPGVRVYVDPPQTDDRVERGDLTGRRTDRVTYVFERGGSFPIDAVVQPWWDLEAGRLRRAQGAGATVAVAAVATPPPPGDRLELWLYAATTAAGLLALLWWAWPRLTAAHAERRARWEASEPRAFRDLQEACRHGDARDVYRAFSAWRRRTDRAATVGPFAEEIESVVFASAAWSPARSRAFAQGLEAVRRAKHSAPTAAVLPPLNPETAVSQVVSQFDSCPAR